MARILHLTLHRRWFVEILSGRKTREYRAITEFWQTRLEGREYDLIRFRNGYASDAPTMDVEWRGLELGEWEGEIVYAIRLGRIVAQENCEWLSQNPSTSMELPLSASPA